mmetsp:Transcript_25799/g.78119  ORF Transcript_25799/g.78119 Transcript_25799/m.78119 type:complete len:122 (+) Transcript_25799:292-657(+)
MRPSGKSHSDKSHSDPVPAEQLPLSGSRSLPPQPTGSSSFVMARYLFVLGGAVALGLRFRRPLQACVAKVRSLPDSLAAISARIGAPAEELEDLNPPDVEGGGGAAVAEEEELSERDFAVG